MGPLTGKVAVVTGGASGIGLSVANRLVGDGANVAVFDRDEYDAETGASIGHIVDVTQQLAVDGAVAETIRRWGRIDVLVNAAGIGASGNILQNDDEEWRRVFDINVMGSVRVIRSVLPHMIDNGTGSVVNVASAVAITGFPNRALYSATKGAIVALTRAMASDHLRDGVRFNSVCPGTTETPWIQRLLDSADSPAEERAGLESRQPHRRLITPEEVADAIAYLASPLAGSTNGVTLSVDAGIHSLYVAN